MSYRTQVADALKTRLLGATPAGASVFTALDRPLQPSDLPAIVIYTPGARRGKGNNDNSLIERDVTVHIEVAIQSTPANALTDADALAQAVEDRIEADPSLGLVVDNTEWQRTTTDVSSFGELTLGVALLEYSVSIYTVRRNEDFIGLEQPLPTSITVNQESTPQAYVEPLTSARIEAPSSPSYFGTEPALVANDIAASEAAPARAPEPAKVTCEGGSCDIAAWEGDQP
jgi:hypothetical protein